MKEAEASSLGGDVLKQIQHSDFIKRMDLAYAAADVVISRSGASSISELCAAHKASIFVPSPNVTEDHQTHNTAGGTHNEAPPHALPVLVTGSGGHKANQTSLSGGGEERENCQNKAAESDGQVLNFQTFLVFFHDLILLIYFLFL